MKFLLLVALLFEVSAFAQTEWPAGEGVCRGRWAFDRYPAWHHEKHGIKSQICEHNAAICGTDVRVIYNICAHKEHGWGPWSEEYYKDSNRFTHMWHDNYVDKDIDMHQDCRKKMAKREIEGGPNLPIPPADNVNVIDYGLSHYARLGSYCTRRDWQKKCQAWKYESEYKCFARWQYRSYAIKQTHHCGIDKEEEVPKHCCHTKKYKVKRTKYSGPAVLTISGSAGHKISKDAINTTDDPEYGGRVPDTEQCRTGDDLTVKNREESQAKFNYLKTNYLEIKPEVEGNPDKNSPIKTEYSALLQTFELMFQHHWEWLDKGQQQWILDQVTHVEANFPELRPNPVLELED